MKSYVALAGLVVFGASAHVATPSGGRGVTQQDTPPPPPIDRTFAPKVVYTANELVKYRMIMDMNLSIKASGGKPLPFPGGQMKADTIVKMKTVGVKPDGTGVVVMSTSGGKMSFMGNSADMPEGESTTMEMDARGRVTKMRGSPKVPGGEMMSAFMGNMNFTNMPGLGVVLPDHPVRVGETWELDTPLPMGDMKMHIVNTLLGIEVVDGKETMKIKQIMTIPFDMKMGAAGPVKDDAEAVMVMTGSMSGNSIQNIQEWNGRVVKSAGEMNGKITMEMKGEAAKQAEQQGIGPTIEMEIGGTVGMNILSAAITKPAPKPAAIRKKPTPAKRNRG